MMPKTRDAVLNKNDTRVLGGSLLDAAMAAFGLPRAAASENIGSEVCGARSSHERLETELIPLREDNALLSSALSSRSGINSVSSLSCELRAPQTSEPMFSDAAARGRPKAAIAASSSDPPSTRVSFLFKTASRVFGIIATR